MASIQNPVNRQNVIDRFRDWVTNYVNSGIVWGSNNWPHGYVDLSGYFGGTTGGLADNLSTGNFPSTRVTAAEVYIALEDVTFQMTRMRYGRFRVVRSGDNAVLFDSTNYTHFNANYRGGLAIIRNRPAGGNRISVGAIEDYFYSLRQSFENIRNSVVFVENVVCHSSCHVSCHASRGRR